ncbi:ATP-binding protein [Streptomyces sp. NPDC023998]|uniref:ATP-binding protein n=1 Tax=Streptomyces sp. NPDC023998 TaxID=3154597 RepID=UPI0034110CF7
MDRTVTRAPRPGETIAVAATSGPRRSALPARPAALDAPLTAGYETSFMGGPWPLPWSPTACGLARTAIRDVLPRWGVGELVPTAELLVSELVCNALRHATGPLHLILEQVSGVRCQVSDGSSKPPRPTDAGPEDEGGRGLALVDMLAARWGYEHSPMGKSVWFELSVVADTPDLDGMDCLDGQNARWNGESGLDGLDTLKDDPRIEAA